MPTPSLLIVPARFKTGKLYSQIPTSGAGDFTVTRNTEARRFDSAGLVASVASGIPRLDYYTSGGVTGCPALLVEPSGTNLCLQSEAFNTTWNKTNLTISANVTATLDPAGGNTADLLTVVTGSTQSELSQAITTVSGTAYVFSVFGKKGSGATELNSFRVLSPGLINTVTINWDTGVISQTGTGATSQNYGNGWWRIVIPFTAGATTTSVQVSTFATFPTGQNSYRWGAQLETGSVATSYIPTTTAAVTRNADVITVSGAVSGSIGQTEGTLYAQVDLRNWTASGRVFAISDGTSDARVIIQVGANRTLQAVVTAASGEVANIATASGQVNGIYKCAVAYASGDFAFYVNGNQVGTDSTGAVPACNNVALGKIETSASTNFLNDRILAAALYNTRLSNTGTESLQALTTP